MEIKLQVKKSDIYKEVAKTTGYVGSKMQGDDTAYKRISTTDENQELLTRFWDESRAVAVAALKGLVSSESMGSDGDTYTITLALSSMFDTALQASMQLSLRSFFVQSIVAKWFVLTNKGEVEQYSTQASALLEDVREKAFHKKAPTRPIYITDKVDIDLTDKEENGEATDINNATSEGTTV